MKREKTKRRASYWVAMGAMSGLVAGTAGQGTAALAYGRATATAWEFSYFEQNPTYHFEISPGLLDEVLKSFETTSGLHVILSREGIGKLPSPGIKGDYTADKALQQILAGTGVVSRYTAAQTITLELQTLAESLDVTSPAPSVSPSSVKYTEPLRDIPQTITVIPKAMIESQGATTLREVLSNVPGITVTAGEGGTPAGDNLTVRGFSARNDVFVDGVRDLGPQSRDSFNMEQIEVVKGPGSAYTGRGSTGGSINLVSKTPALNRFFSGSLMLGSADNRRFTGDANVPVKALGERTAFRLSLMGTDAGVPGRDVVKNQRWGAAPSLSFGLSSPTRLTLSYFHLQQDNISDYGIPWVPATNNALIDYRDKPAPVPRNTFYGLKSRDFEKMQSDLGTVSFERDFTDGISLRDQIRYGHSTRDSNATPPRFASNDSTVINRELRSWNTEDSILDNQTNLTARFQTGKIQHALTTGMALTRETNIRKTRTGVNMATTLLDPNADDTYTGVITTSPSVGDITGNSTALYAFDTAKFGKRWELTGGMRWERFAVDGVSTTLAPVVRTDDMTSGRAGLVYKPAEAGSIYVSYGTSLNPSLEGLSYSTANTAIEPEKTYNLEAGSKWDLLGSRLLLSGAVFRVEKTNARTPGLLPDDPPQVLNGRQRASGAEFGATGTIIRGWKLFGAYTFLDATIVKSNTAVEVGKQIQNAPKHSSNIWSTYRLRKLEAGGGVRFVGRRYGNNTNSRYVDSYWTADAMASYTLSKHVDLRLNLYNLNDDFYFERLGGGHVVPGAARSIVVSTGFHF